MVKIVTPNGTIRFEGPAEKAKEYAELINLKNYKIIEPCTSTSESKSSATPSTSAT